MKLIHIGFINPLGLVKYLEIQQLQVLKHFATIVMALLIS